MKHIAYHLVGLIAIPWAGALLGQANESAAYPTHPLAPVILAWEPNGADYQPYTREMNSRPFPPHRIIANVYYVGTSGHASYLITSDRAIS